jgi:predicted dehydrogenase
VTPKGFKAIEDAAFDVRRIGIGVLGYGFMGKVHSNAYLKIPYSFSAPAAFPDLIAICGRDEARVADAAARMRYRGYYTDWKQMVQDPRIEIIDNVTPDDRHRAPSIAAAQAGKHVICEKPLATDVGDTADLVALAVESGLVAAVPFAYRFYPSVRSARRRIREGSTGAVRLIHGTYLQDWLSRPEDDSWRIDPSIGGPSRAFADIGVHWCDLVEFVTGYRLTRLSALFVVGDRPTEDGATVMFETDLGAVGTVAVSQVSPGRKNRLWFSVDAQHESLQFDQEQPDSLWIGGRETTQVEARGTHPGPWDFLPVGHPQGYQDCFTGFITDVHVAIGGGSPDGLPTFADGHRAAIITDAVLRSAAQRSWIDVAP